MEKLELQKISVELSGLSDIMFDRFIDHSKEMRPPEQKLYLSDGNKMIFPAGNLDSFLFGSKPPPGCAAKFEGKQGKNYCTMGMGHVFIDPMEIGFLSDGEPVVFNDFNSGQFYIHESSPIIGAGQSAVKAEVKPRPVLRLPWSLSFVITIIKNGLIDETKIYNWFVAGGVQIGLGTYRPKFGRFAVDMWEKI